MSHPPLIAQAIVHIGYHKTATTWLQQQLFPLAVSHDVLSRKIVQDALLGPGGLHFDAGAAEAVLGLAGRQRPVLISDENLSGYLHNGGLHGMVAPEMARRIRAVLPGARIAIFIRNQFEVLRASYAQYVSGGGTWSPQRYFASADCVKGALTRPWKAPVFEFEHFEFDRLVAYYDDLFGRANVHVYPYEWLHDRAGLISRLEQDLGLSLGGAPVSGGPANPSFGAAGLMLLRGVNLFTCQSVVNKRVLIDLPYGQILRHAAKRILGLVPGCRGSARLPDTIRARAAAHYPESNRRLMELRDLPLAELGYPL